MANTYDLMTKTAWSRERPTSGDTESELAARYKEDWAIISPYLQELLNAGVVSSGSDALVDAARKQIQRTAMGTDESMNQRQMGRGNVNLTPSQQLAIVSNNSISAAANNTANMNTARINQYESNTNALNRLIATTNAMKKGSASTLNGIAQNEANREMQRQNLAAQEKQSKWGTLGTIATLGLMVF